MKTINYVLLITGLILLPYGSGAMHLTSDSAKVKEGESNLIAKNVSTPTQTRDLVNDDRTNIDEDMSLNNESSKVSDEKSIEMNDEKLDQNQKKTSRDTERVALMIITLMVAIAVFMMHKDSL